MKKVEIDRREILDMLGELYPKTVSGYAPIPLRAFFSTGSKVVRSKAQYLAKAMVLLRILEPEGNSPHWRYRWRWQEVGGPSIKMAEEIIDCARALKMESQAEARKRHLRRMSAQLTVSVIRRDTPSCRCCPESGNPQVCEFFHRIGFDCKAHRMETFKIKDYETGVGQ